MNILLIAGGWSSEREVSLNGAQAMQKALVARGHRVTFFDLLGRFDALLACAQKHDFAFINLHGAPGEDGLVQALLEVAGCPYQGSSPAGSFLALHKAAAKQVLRAHNLPTPDWEFLPCPPGDTWAPRLPFPLFVKSNTGGSSLLLAKVQHKDELCAMLQRIFAAGCAALLEEALEGQEVTCGVLGERPLPPVLIEPVAGPYFDYHSKYQQNGAREICPAPLPGPLYAHVQELALAAHRALNLTGYSRADFIVDSKGRPHLLEVNTLPGMTATSLLPQEAAAVGLDFGQLLEELIKMGLARHHKPAAQKRSAP